MLGVWRGEMYVLSIEIPAPKGAVLPTRAQTLPIPEGKRPRTSEGPWGKEQPKPLTSDVTLGKSSGKRSERLMPICSLKHRLEQGDTYITISNRE